MRSSAWMTGSMAVVLPLALVAPAAAQSDRSATCVVWRVNHVPQHDLTAAEAITGGSFTPPGATNAIANLRAVLPGRGRDCAYCGVQIQFEVWLPLEKWSGRFSGVVNGGWAGTISFGALAAQIRRDVASASTNTGHQSAGGVNMARFAYEHPEQLIDFAYRAHHETTLKAKALTQAFYGKPPGARLLDRLFVGRLRGPDGGPAIPRRLRRHRRRGAWPTTGRG